MQQRDPKEKTIFAHFLHPPDSQAHFLQGKCTQMQGHIHQCGFQASWRTVSTFLLLPPCLFSCAHITFRATEDWTSLVQGKSNLNIRVLQLWVTTNSTGFLAGNWSDSGTRKGGRIKDQGSWIKDDPLRNACRTTRCGHFQPCFHLTQDSNVSEMLTNHTWNNTEHKAEHST